MTDRLGTVVLDTNVWVDNYLTNRSGHDAAGELLERLWKEKATIAFCPVSAKDIFFVTAQELKRECRQELGTLSEADALACNEIAWGCVQNMMDNAVAANIGQAEMWLAVKYKRLHNDFEDNLIIAAAQSAEADYFVTNDQALLGKCPVTAFTPQGMVDYLKC